MDGALLNSVMLLGKEIKKTEDSMGEMAASPVM